MDSDKNHSDDRIPLIEVLCPKCGAKFLVPKCIDAGILLCPCCCPIPPTPCCE